MNHSNSEKKWRGRAIAYAPLIFWIGVIFFNSSSAGAMSNTSRFVRPLLEFFFPGSPEESIALYHGYIRKLAHFAEYAVLAFWASLAFSNSANRILRRRWEMAALLTVVLVAVADETNQSFNAARTGSAWDVAIDFAGGLAVVLFFQAAKSVREKRAKRKLASKTIS